MPKASASIKKYLISLLCYFISWQKMPQFYQESKSLIAITVITTVVLKRIVVNKP
jgi:hypothetical protein